MWAHRPLVRRYRVIRLFDDLLGAGEDRWRDRQAERLGGIEIDHQLEGRRLLDRQIGRLRALQDPYRREVEQLRPAPKQGRLHQKQ